MVQYKVLEQNHPRIDAKEKVTGHATYAADVYLPGMLWSKLATSQRGHARILSIDTSAAEALPGVRAVVTGPGLPRCAFRFGRP